MCHGDLSKGIATTFSRFMESSFLTEVQKLIILSQTKALSVKHLIQNCSVIFDNINKPNKVLSPNTAWVRGIHSIGKLENNKDRLHGSAWGLLHDMGHWWWMLFINDIIFLIKVTCRVCFVIIKHTDANS